MTAEQRQCKLYAGNTIEDEGWHDRWKKGLTRWMIPFAHPMLKKHFNRLQISSNLKLKVFFPLCGETLDMKWLYEEGHEVVGVELSEIAVRSFFSKHFRNDFIEKPIKDVDGNIFSTLDGRLRIYQMNFFKFGPYCAILGSVCSPACRSLLETYYFDPIVYGGPPHSIPPERVHEMFGSTWTVERVEEMTREEFVTQFNITALTQPLRETAVEVHYYMLEKIS